MSAKGRARIKLSILQEIDVPKSKVVEQMSQGLPLLFASSKNLLEEVESLSATRCWREDHLGRAGAAVGTL